MGTHVVAYRVGRDQLIVRLQRGVMTGIDEPGLPDARDLPEDYREALLKWLQAARTRWMSSTV